MYKQFNVMASTFLLRMEETFPDEQKIKTYRQHFLLLQSMNSEAPVAMFMENMEPFGREILTENENFFKQDKFVNNAESISGKMGITKYWDSLSIQTKEAIWQYIKGLYVLGMGSIGKSKELKEMLESIK